MNLKISSEKLQNPLLVTTLKKLTESFEKMGHDFYVIGATARDLITLQLPGVYITRRTRDLDIAIAIPDWSVFDKIEAGLVADGFKKSRHAHQRFFLGEYELDMVPYGGVAKNDEKIYWPPEETIAMSVKGFDTVLSQAITVDIDDDFSVKIASLHGLFILKFNAWMDRNMATSKDAEDMSFIISNYFMANIERDIHPEVYDWEDFDDYVAGAYWLAHDIVSLLSREQIAYYQDCITRELENGEGSLLFNHIIDHCRGVNYEEVRNAWQAIVNVFEQTK